MVWLGETIDPPGSVTYTFNGVSLSDQGMIFQCLTSRQSSKLLSLIVYRKSLLFIYIDLYACVVWKMHVMRGR